MPTPQSNIDAAILYILDNWVQNSNKAITGTIGQNVVWNLAQFIKQNPENWEKATIISSETNYVTLPQDCIIIFNNDSSGTILLSGNIWNKYYLVNATDNVIGFANDQFYYDINGSMVTALAARSTAYISLGEDDNWYSTTTSGSGAAQIAHCLRLQVGDEGAPVAGQSTLQRNELIGLDPVNTPARLSMKIDGQWQDSWGGNQTFDYNSAAGTISIRANVWNEESSIEIPLTKTIS